MNPSTGATVQVTVQEGATVVGLSGEHDLATLGAVQAAIDAAVARGGAVVIDLSRCEFIGCCVAQALSGAGDGARPGIVIGPATPAIVRRLLDLLELPFTEVPSEVRSSELGG
jgi:anti-anti-sigma regulatory factor